MRKSSGDHVGLGGGVRCFYRAASPRTLPPFHAPFHWVPLSGQLGSGCLRWKGPEEEAGPPHSSDLGSQSTREPQNPAQEMDVVRSRTRGRDGGGVEQAGACSGVGCHGAESPGDSSSGDLGCETQVPGPSSVCEQKGSLF